MASPRPKNQPMLAGFFLTVFVFGQLMANWALYSGHMAAWICGMLFSVFGVVIAIGSYVSQIRHQQRRIHQLESGQPVATRQQEQARWDPGPHARFSEGQKVSA